MKFRSVRSFSDSLTGRSEGATRGREPSPKGELDDTGPTIISWAVWIALTVYLWPEYGVLAIFYGFLLMFPVGVAISLVFLVVAALLGYR